MALTLSLPSETREYLKVTVEATRNGVAVDPSAGSVEFAFPLAGDPPSQWFPGGWERSNRTWFARCLIGPGSPANLPEGVYAVWVRVANAPERPAREVGVLEIT